MKLRYIKKAIGITAIVYICYLLVGALAPFVHQKEVTATDTEGTSRYYGTSESVDRAAIVETNKDALDTRIRMIERATHSIVLSTFDMREGKSSKQIGAALLAASDRGVKVKILVDGISGMIRMEGSPFFYALASYPNIEIRIYNKPNLAKPWTFNGRMHDKYLIVDDKYYLVGGRNTFDYFLGEYGSKNKSYDREVLIYNTANGSTSNTESSIHELYTYFESVWESQYCVDFHKDERLQKREKVAAQISMLREQYESMKNKHKEWFDHQYSFEEHTVPTQKVSLISGETHIYGKKPLVWKELSALMKQAEERVTFHTPYAVLGTEMYRDLKEISKKVADFNLVINDVGTGDNFVATSDYLRHKEEILATGVTVKEFVGTHSSHGKSLIIDDRISIVGSYNFDLRSTYMDTELMVVVDSVELNQELERYFQFFEDQTRTMINGTGSIDNYEIEMVEIEPVQLMAWKVVGFILQPFRFVI